jgi:hypothetical protein
MDCAIPKLLLKLFRIFDQFVARSNADEICMVLWSAAKVKYFEQVFFDRCLAKLLETPKQPVAFENLFFALSVFQYNKPAITWPLVE